MKSKILKKSTPKKLTKLIIDRTKWLRGGVETSLYETLDKAKCCLGFLGQACGIPLSEMKDNGIPADIHRSIKKWPKWVITIQKNLYGIIIYGDSRWTEKAIKINDGLMTEAKRECELKKHFAKKGINLIFVGEGFPSHYIPINLIND